MENGRILDVIREVVNIGIGDAADALSRLVNSRVSITVPDIRIIDAVDVPAFIKNETQSTGIYISQDFQGISQGKALLFYSRKSGRALLRSLLGDTAMSSTFSETAMATPPCVRIVVTFSDRSRSWHPGPPRGAWVPAKRLAA